MFCSIYSTPYTLTPSCYCLQAPEALVEGKRLRKLTASLDIYAFGIMMYEVATCQAAYHGRGAIEEVVINVRDNHLRPSWPASTDVPSEYRSAGRVVRVGGHGGREGRVPPEYRSAGRVVRVRGQGPGRGGERAGCHPNTGQRAGR